MLNKNINAGDLCVYAHRGFYGKDATIEKALCNKHNEVMIALYKNQLKYFGKQRFTYVVCLTSSGRVLNISRKFLCKVN